MVSFSCEGCCEIFKKPKLDQHSGRCRAPFTCIDCSKTFRNRSEWSGHTSCISEAEKYEKTLYKGPPGKKNAPKKAPKDPYAANFAAMNNKPVVPPPQPEKVIVESVKPAVVEVATPGSELPSVGELREEEKAEKKKKKKAAKEEEKKSKKRKAVEEIEVESAPASELMIIAAPVGAELPAPSEVRMAAAEEEKKEKKKSKKAKTKADAAAEELAPKPTIVAPTEGDAEAEAVRKAKKAAKKEAKKAAKKTATAAVSA